MDPAEAPILPQWISIFSNTYLLGFSLLLSVCIISLMFCVLRGRSCQDWYLALFTTLAFFNLLMLFPFVQSSQLAPGEITDQFIDIDRPWLMILTYGFTAFILIASTTSVEYILIFIKPSWKDRSWVTVLRLFTTLVSLSLPAIDVSNEWAKEEASTHCLDNVCRWFLIRKDASLCILLLLWSLSVAITLISANLDHFLLLPQQLRLWRESKKPEPATAEEEESAMAYQRQLRMERQRAAEIIEMRRMSGRGAGETVPLTIPFPPTTPHPSTIGPHPPSTSVPPTAPPEDAIEAEPPHQSTVDRRLSSHHPTVDRRLSQKSTGKTGVSYPSTVQSTVPYLSTADPVVQYPSTVNADLPYPPTVKTVVPYTATVETVAPYPSTVETGLPYPPTIPTGLPYPSSVGSGVPYPSDIGTGLPYPPSLDTGLPHSSHVDPSPPYPRSPLHPRATRHTSSPQSLVPPNAVKRRVSEGFLLSGDLPPERSKGRRPSQHLPYPP